MSHPLLHEGVNDVPNGSIFDVAPMEWVSIMAKLDSLVFTDDVGTAVGETVDDEVTESVRYDSVINFLEFQA